MPSCVPPPSLPLLLSLLLSCDPGATKDADGDGFLPLDVCPSGSDCDDADSTIYPDAPETCGDGEDQDCDGVDTSCRFGGAYDPDDATFSLSATSQTAGIGMESGDVDGDGLTEVVVLAGPFGMGLYGAWVVNGPLTESTDFDSVSYSLYGQDFGTPTANALGMGDANGDGLIDVLLGASSDDKAYLVLGPIVADLDLADADALFFGESNTHTGNAVELGDLNGDGLADALLGAFWYSSLRGAVYLKYAPFDAEIDLEADADAFLLGPEDSLTGERVRAGEDLDGDGQADLTLGAPIESLTYPTAGGAYVFYGPLGGVYLSEDADAEYHGNFYQSEMGTAVLGADSDGDGILELWISTPGRGALESVLIYALD